MTNSCVTQWAMAIVKEWVSVRRRLSISRLPSMEGLRTPFKKYTSTHSTHSGEGSSGYIYFLEAKSKILVI